MSRGLKESRGELTQRAQGGELAFVIVHRNQVQLCLLPNLPHQSRGLHVRAD